MKACVYSVTKKYFAIVLVGVVGLLTLNNALFMHIHKLPNGQLVVHAHPFSNTTQSSNDQTSHQHSKVELLIFDSLQLLYSNTQSFGAITLDQNQETTQFFYRATVRENAPQNISNKAPPTSIRLA